jgi:hypothetical protein
MFLCPLAYLVPLAWELIAVGIPLRDGDADCRLCCCYAVYVSAATCLPEQMGSVGVVILKEVAAEVGNVTPKT